MENCNINHFKSQLSSNKNKTVLFGAGHLGEIALYSCNQLSIPVHFFCDSDKTKQDSKFLGVETISLEKLKELGYDVNIFVTNNNVLSVGAKLKKEGFRKVYNCTDLFKNTDFSKITGMRTQAPSALKIKRKIEFYDNMCLKKTYELSKVLHVNSLDVQVTERCSLKCKNCCNLMQYYERPVNIVFDQLFLSLDRFVAAVDKIDEFRIIGGDPFMNKEMYKAINKSKEYNKVGKIIVYTNAKIIPKGENLNCLKHNKVILDISNYGGELATKHDEILKVLDDNNVAYSYSDFNTWTDSGRILPFQKRTEEENKKVFSECCNRDTLSVLHGKLYRCPFSANAHNLKAIPVDKSDQVDLSDDKIPISTLKEQIRKLAYQKDYLTACLYCNGRDYTTPVIKAAEQTKKPLSYKRI